jgi:DNA-binding GntR family transcriptional regulator
MEIAVRRSGRNGSLADAAYAGIKRLLLRCQLAPGEPVTEEELAARLGLNRGVVRPALKRLVQEGLVQAVSLRRYIVAPITVQDAHDLFALRLLNEPPSARIAAGRISAEQLDRLDSLAAVGYQADDPDSIDAFFQANTELHLTVARASGNQLMVEVVAMLLDRVERMNHLAHSLTDRSGAAYLEHHDLAEALRAGDGDRAAEVMADGIDAARHFVVGALMSSPTLLTTNVSAFSPRGRE